MSRRWKLLGARDTIVAAYAEGAAGPGWANQPVWLVVRDGDGNLRMECLQPDEQSSEMLMLYPFSQLAHNSMTGAARRLLELGYARKVGR